MNTRDINRSRIMRKIKSKNTKPELIVRKICRDLGIGYRIHLRDLPGTPDLVFQKYKICIFVNGCFWHRHLNCKYAYSPKTNIEFWDRKFQKNIQRDIDKNNQLAVLGWKAITVWECETRNPEELHAKLSTIFTTK